MEEERHYDHVGVKGEDLDTFFSKLEAKTVGQILSLLYLVGERDFVEKGATFVFGRYLLDTNAADNLLLTVWCQGRIGQVKTLHMILVSHRSLFNIVVVYSPIQLGPCFYLASQQ